MTYTAVVEIPRGSDRRIHKSNETGEFIDFGSIKERIPVNDGKMPVHYGFLKGVINPVEKDEVDALFFSESEYATGDEVEVVPFGILLRDDGDHKVFVCDKGESHLMNLSDIPSELYELIRSYFGYGHIILGIHGNEEAGQYLLNCQ